MTDLPTSWADEAWPLEDPTPPPTFRPRNWSDTHDDPPQVADLAVEAQRLVDEHGWAMGEALVHLQRREELRARSERAAAAFQEAVDQIATVFTASAKEIGELVTTITEAFRTDLAASRPSRRPQPMCPTHGVLARGGFCRRCSARARGRHLR